MLINEKYVLMNPNITSPRKIIIIKYSYFRCHNNIILSPKIKMLSMAKTSNCKLSMAKSSNLLCPFQKLVTNKTVTSFCNGLDVDTSFCHGQGYKTEKILVFAMDDIFKFCKK